MNNKLVKLIKFWLPLFILIFINFKVISQNKHIIEYEGKGNNTSINKMTQRITKAANEYSSKYYNKIIPRIALYDMAFADDKNEYSKLNSYGVLYISSLNRDINEYPLKKVYFESNNRKYELIKIKEIKVEVRDSLIKKVFGNNRIDYFYLIPYAISRSNGKLKIDWNKNRNNFEIAEFPGTIKLRYH